MSTQLPDQFSPRRALRPDQRRSAGIASESLAATFLEQQGLQLVERNYHSRLGEIDLIMRHGQTLVFIEVRFRTSNSFVHPLASVNRRKQQRIIRAAQVYLKHHGLSDQVSCRLDVLGISRDTSGGLIYDWVKGAFTA